MKEIPEIPGYKIEKQLGQGGMATVYLGVQENLNREVAIKILNPDMFKDEQYVQRFLNEAHTASRLVHPNIVTIHDVGQVGPYCYIVMERLQESLIERVKFRPDSKLNPVEAFKIIRQMSEALDYAHKEGFIHRDIKPDNILFRKDGTPVLVDFGIARALDARSNLTSTGMIIGTPHYMSPEQCRGEKIDGQSDFYSLGTVLYEILTGDVPYKADSTAGILFKHVKDPIPKLPQDLRKYQPIINRMMSKEKRTRVHCGTELIRLMDAYKPDSRVETIKGIKSDEWVFDSPPDDETKKSEPVSEKDDVVLLEPSLTGTVSHPVSKSRGPMFVILLSIPFILAAVYFLFFHAQLTGDKPDNKDAVVKQEAPKDENAAGGTEKNAAEPAEKDRGKSEKAGNSNKTRGNNNKKANEDTESDIQYRQYMILAEEFLKHEEYEKALENIRKAREVKDTAEAAEMETKVTDQLEILDEQNYLKYFNSATEHFENKNYGKARENLDLARQYRSNEQLDALEKKIEAVEKQQAAEKERAKAVAARKQRLLRQDDQAYERARARNTIYSYEKYLKKYPNGRHAAEAQKKYDQLKEVILLENKIQDDTVYETACKKGTIEALDNYLKKYPYGRHVEECKTKIEALRARLLKDTKIKVELQQLRFFESGRRAAQVGVRTYKTRFPKQGTRYIYTELSYSNNLYRVAGSRNPVTLVYIRPGSAFKMELKGTIVQEKDVREGLYWRGLGWSDPGKWTAGTYEVSIYVNGTVLGKAQFEIY